MGRSFLTNAFLPPRLPTSEYPLWTKWNRFDPDVESPDDVYEAFLDNFPESVVDAIAPNPQTSSTPPNLPSSASRAANESTMPSLRSLPSHPISLRRVDNHVELVLATAPQVVQSPSTQNASRPQWEEILPMQPSHSGLGHLQVPATTVPEGVAEPSPPPPEPASAVASWATWQPNPILAPTPPPVQPMFVVPERDPGLFGPRSPRETPPPEPARTVASWATWQPNPLLPPTPPSLQPMLLVPERQIAMIYD